MYSGYGMGELAVSPLDANYASAVTALRFSPHHEALWAGTDVGHLYTLQCPTLQPYAHWQAHPSEPVLEVVAAGDGVLSLSQHRLALHGLGGAPRWSMNDAGGQFSALCVDGGTAGSGGAGGRAVLGRNSHRMSLVDLASGKVAVEQDVMGLLGGEGITLLRGPLSRGSLCCATSLGRLALIDPRAKLRVDSALTAALGGVAALDARGDTVAAAGYGVRAGQVVAENCVKIFDMRAGLRLLFSLPVAGTPAALCFHPLLPASLLVALPSAMFCLADAATGVASSVYQADMASDSLSAATISGSGELVALGGSGGYVHIWGDLAGGPGPGGGAGGPGSRHRVNKAASSTQPPTPAARPKPAVALQEDDHFASAPQYTPAVPLGAPPGALPPPSASDFDASETAAVGLPPRVFEPGLRRDIRVVDGVGYLPNPHYSRSKALPDMVRELAGLRHGPTCRLSMKADWVDPAAAREERQRLRAAEGGVVLPLRYQHVEIRHYGRLKWEEFDFSYYNRTRFAGLENDLPNAYCNALLQVLYFVPEFRSLALSHAPEPDVEFCLTCELSFLFGMLQRAVGLPCQATNLLRTLRSLREAAALGLLDGGGIGPAAGTASDAGVAAAGAAALGAAGGGGGPGSAEMELSRRVAALSRFVLEQMHREASNARTPSTGPFRSGISPQPAPANAAMAPALEALMAISFRQRMTSLTGPGADSVREARAFQVDLQYPASREKAARAVEEARLLGLSRLPGAAPTQDGQHPGGGGGAPPTFSELLQRSLLAVSATRAWLEEARGYALVRKVRVPLSLPPLLTVNVAAGDSEEAEWWLPDKGPDGQVPPGEANRLPWAIAVVSRPQAWEVEVHQADTAEELYDKLGTSLYGTGVVSCVYELCGAVFQIRDLDEASDRSGTRPGGKPHQGHLVAMVKVPQQYWDEIPEPRLTKAPAGSMAEFVQGRQPATTAAAAAAATTTATATVAAAAVVVVVDSSGKGVAVSEKAGGKPVSGRGGAATATSAGGAVQAAGAATATSGQAQVVVAAVGAAWAASASEPPPISEGADGAAANGGGANGGGGGSGSTRVDLGLGSISLPDDLDDIFATGLSFGAELLPLEPRTEAESAASKGTPTAAAAPAAAGASGVGNPMQRRPSSGGAAGLRPPSSSGQVLRGHPQGPDWVLFNDFSVVPNCPPHEVTATYSNQKLPCLLQYRQVPPPSHLAAAAAAAAATTAAAGTAASTTSTAATASAAGSGAGGAGGDGGGGGGWKKHGASQRGGAGGAAAAAPPPAAAAAAAAATPAALIAAGSSPAPLLTQEQFRLLCCAPPLQGPMAGLPPFRFKPLDLVRMGPRPGLRFAIDAEFVASSPPESRAVERLTPEPGGGGLGGFPGSQPHLPTLLQGGAGAGGAGPQQQQQQHFQGPGPGMDLVQFKQSRLTLARVAVVVAEPGPLAGSCCVDDYIRVVEPVYDYLTRWSGIQPGDLDPAVSRHYTTTLKHTYLKLKHLLDSGCVFVGHDLRKDFRCINMVVPPEQVVDTSELFRHRGARKLSLRFLASYLLGATLQGAAGPHMPPQMPPGPGPAGAVGGPGMHPHVHPHMYGNMYGGMPGPGGPGGGGGGHGGSPFPPGGAPFPPPPPPQSHLLLGHDAIEDARMAMRLYHKYLELVANDSFTRVLNEMYAWGKLHGWDPAALRPGAAGVGQQ